MKLPIYAFLVTGLLLASARAEDAKEAKEVKPDKDQMSYAFGTTVGNSWRQQDLGLMDLDMDVVFKAIKNSLANGPSQMTDQQVTEAMAAFRKEHQAKALEKRKQLGEKNKVAGEAFLAENKKKPGVITLPSGLQYKVLKEGTGESPKSSDIVSVNYRGTLIDGTEFDSSAAHTRPGQPPQPAKFNIHGVIPGWTEALQLMKIGSKWEIYIPSDLAYKERGSGPKIGPNAALVFDVELLSAETPVPPAPPGTQKQVTSDIIKVPSAEELKKGAQIEVIKPEDVQKYQKKDQGAQKK